LLVGNLAALSRKTSANQDSVSYEDVGSKIWKDLFEDPAVDVIEFLDKKFKKLKDVENAKETKNADIKKEKINALVKIIEGTNSKLEES